MLFILPLLLQQWIHAKTVVCHLYAVHLWIVLWGESEARGNIKKSQSQINHTHFSGFWHISHKHFRMMGSVLIRCLVSEQTNCKLAVLATACGSKNKHGRAVWVCHKYLSCASGRHRRFLQIPYTAPRETKNSISKEVRLNFSATLFVFSQWRTFMKGLFSSLSPLHTVCLHYTSPVKDLLCFLSRLLLRYFCNSFHFSWDSTC